MNIFGIGLPELAVIAAIGLLVFGPKRLPELGKTLGRTLKGFQSASREFEQEFRRAIDTETVSTDTLSAETLASAEAAALSTHDDPLALSGVASEGAVTDALRSTPASGELNSPERAPGSVDVSSPSSTQVP